MQRQIGRGNQILSQLSESDFELLRPKLTPIELTVGLVLFEVNMPIDYAYFPLEGTLSAVVVMEDGTMIEAATIGNEGAVGLSSLATAEVSPNRVFVQVPGKALRIGADELRALISKSKNLRHLAAQYQAAFLFQVSRSVACNGLHSVQQRCARWLLMTHDRIGSDEIVLTHEILSIMLGVRRATVTEVLQELQGQSLLSCGRGRITILNRKALEKVSCECYRAVRNYYVQMLG